MNIVTKLDFLTEPTLTSFFVKMDLPNHAWTLTQIITFKRNSLSQNKNVAVNQVHFLLMLFRKVKHMIKLIE